MSMLRKEEKTFVDLFLVLSKVVLFSELKRYLLPDNNREKLQNPVKETRYFYSANVTKALVCGFHMDKIVLRDTS